MLPIRDTYEQLCRDFRWNVPEKFNIGVAVSDDWAVRDSDRICLQHFNPGGQHLSLTYGAFAARSSSFAQGLLDRGVMPADRVAILLPQGFETAIAHAGIYKLGGIALPLALLFGVEALEYRLRDAGASALVTNRYGHEKVAEIRSRLPDLKCIVLTDGDAPGAIPFEELANTPALSFKPADTTPDDPAMMIYTSGTTGPPKGALHGHRVLLGHVPGFQFHHAFLPQSGDRMWTPADWAWAGGLLNALLPSLLLGVPVVSSPGQKFDPHMAFRILEEMDVRNAFIPPTALRLMKSVENPRSLYRLNLRTIGSAGEALGRETWEQASTAFGIPVNEFYGQTECNIVLSSAANLGVLKPGSMGKAAPGHEVAIIDGEGRALPAGTVGQVAVRRPDPVMFLGYWKNEAATAAKFIGDWMTTGDQGVQDEEGYVTFFGRDDDVITSSGYRIGPGEIEDCLAGHPAVQLAAAIGKPDPVRTEIVKAYIVLKPGHKADPALETDIRNWVKTRLSMHEYPREIEFLDSLPLTTSGKVIRRILRDRAMADAVPTATDAARAI
ncbi:MULTISPECIES: AMP-binding protein [unclassified Rhizobium]|uniref:AMP-binding protein n=1 Tax=unclassified Rhizobium TaxID=2613769 RepID=UPI0007152386|nr:MULTISPECIES: AMP-binding protein [unclassified Rhizobium]KQS95133.1 AMP-dependent synthetase [Rhizobium sp. Leaf386]KQS95667.1 AMP-dependent synthetase [Rhizobium sp. Leaf391]KQU01894.1 AMP-dependent synthetase [Rhizobium sp. Leaf453]